MLAPDIVPDMVEEEAAKMSIKEGLILTNTAKIKARHGAAKLVRAECLVTIQTRRRANGNVLLNMYLITLSASPYNCMIGKT